MIKQMEKGNFTIKMEIFMKVFNNFDKSYF